MIKVDLTQTDSTGFPPDRMTRRTRRAVRQVLLNLAAGFDNPSGRRFPLCSIRTEQNSWCILGGRSETVSLTVMVHLQTTSLTSISVLIEQPLEISEPEDSDSERDLYFEVLELQPIRLSLSFERTDRLSGEK